MKIRVLPLAILLAGIHSIAFGQVFTFDFFAHNSYTNETPGEVIVMNDQWQNSITYTGSGDGYHVRYVIDTDNSTIETFICDYGQLVTGAEYTLEHIDVLASRHNYLHLYNPVSKKTSLFYLDENGDPTFIVENADGKGKFSIGEDFSYFINWFNSYPYIVNMKTLGQLKAEILADGIIDASEVNELKSILFADGVIDKEEAEFLFELNDAVSGNSNHPSWGMQFVDAISSFLLEDETSPGEIDEEEAQWLYDKLSSDGQIDDLEKSLLHNLKSKAKGFPEVLSQLLANWLREQIGNSVWRITGSNSILWTN